MTPSKLLRAQRWLKSKADEANLADYLIVLLTTVIAFWAGMTWLEMHNAGQQTDKIIAADERIATAMEKTVGQARDALNASIEASRNDQRAWVGITRIEIRSLQPGQKIEINTPLQNSGKTAAVDVRTRSFVHISDTPVNITAFVASRHDPFQARMTIFPNIQDANITIVSPFPYSEAEIAAIKNGRKLMYAFGEIKYRDVFGRLHHTFFCGIYATTTPNNMRFCNEYNGAD